MAGDLNHVMLVGRFTRDPELRQLNTGTNLCRFSVANNNIYTSNGKKNETVSFFNCVAWGRLAEIIQQYCHKGKQVALSGRLSQNSWQDNDGKKNSSVELVVDQLQLLGAVQNKDGNNLAPMSMGKDERFKSTASVSQEEKVVEMMPSSEGHVNPDDDDIPF